MNKSFKISMIVLISLVVAGGISLLLVKENVKKGTTNNYSTRIR